MCIHVMCSKCHRFYYLNCNGKTLCMRAIPRYEDCNVHSLEDDKQQRSKE